METDRKIIHMSRTKGNEEVMVTVDDDFILPEARPDIKSKIKDQGEIIIEKIRGMEDKINIGGYLRYKLLYRTETGCGSTEGKIPFEEIITMEGVTPQDIIKCVSSLEDLSIHVVHSRKISVKALVRVSVAVKSLYEKEAISKIEMENLQSRKRSINAMSLLSSQKDIYRIRETLGLPSSAGSADKILWYELETEGMEYRLRDGELGIKGELSAFCIYTCNQEEKLNFHSEKIPFSGKIALNNSVEEAYPDINVCISEKNMVLKPDNNGEQRLLDIEVILDLDIKAYGEENTEVLFDAYSPSRELNLKREKIVCENVVLKNSLQCRVEGSWGLQDRDVMQILNTAGTVYVEEIVSTEEGISVEGAVTVDVLYLRANEEEMVGFGRYKLPFTQKVDGIKYGGNYSFNCKTEGLKINAVLMNGEISIKGVLGIDIMVTDTVEEDIVCDVQDSEPDYARIKELPGITGYIAKSEDTLWDIAKRYGTTVSKIMEINNLASEELKSGMKLLVVKSC